MRNPDAPATSSPRSKDTQEKDEHVSRLAPVEGVIMYKIVAVAFAVLCAVGPLSVSCQSYDDTVPVSNWRIDGGLQASCPGKDYPTTGWQGET